VRIPSLFPLLALAIAACVSLPPDEGEQPFTASDVELEKQIAAQAMQQIGGDLRPYPDYMVQDYLRRVGEKIVAVSDRRDIAWTFQVIDSDEMNAFTIGDGKVFFYTGLLTRLENEAQLAAVMAHEIAHVTRFHTVITAQQMQQTALIAGVAGAALGGNELAALASEVAGSIIVNGFSREQEDQADRVALMYMSQAGYDVNQFPRVFEIFQEVGGDPPELYNDLFGSHSTNASRISISRQIIAQRYAGQRSPFVGAAEYQQMLTRVRTQ
jgi:predicted Zn-dependent protease